jgi:hypothetical protein
MSQVSGYAEDRGMPKPRLKTSFDSSQRIKIVTQYPIHHQINQSIN